MSRLLLLLRRRGDTTAPTLVSATIEADGQTFTLVFSEAVSRGAGWTDTLFSYTGATGEETGTATLAYASGDGTNTWALTGGTIALDDDTVLLTYLETADGVEDAAGNDLAAITDRNTTNNSIQT